MSRYSDSVCYAAVGPADANINKKPSPRHNPGNTLGCWQIEGRHSISPPRRLEDQADFFLSSLSLTSVNSASTTLSPAPFCFSAPAPGPAPASAPGPACCDP